MMGSPESEPGRKSGEIRRQVTVSDFYMSEKTITNEQFCVFLNENNVYGNGEMQLANFGSKRLVHKNNSVLKYENSLWSAKSGKENHPVVYVSWFGASACCEWLGGRLPAEAEWEYACRAGTDTAFNTGKNLTTSQANYNGNKPYDGNAPGVYAGDMQPVGSYPPNAWGLYDMHGNVYEWCLDEFRDNPTLPQTSPIVQSGGRDFVLRGGSFASDSRKCRSASRIRGYLYNIYFGFRAVLPV
jgi:formylglycine-generating enzyme required for sulfatase activity